MASKRNVRLRGTRLQFRRKVPLTLRALFRRSEIVVPLHTSSARIAAIRARQAWLAVEGIFRRVSDQATITPEQIEELIQRALAELAWKHEIVLAQDGRFFDVSGDPPKDVDALILESHAEESREALALNDLKPVADVIDKYAAKVGIKVAPNSVDERLVGRALLKAFAESFDQAAERFRREIMPYLPDPAPDPIEEECAILDDLERQMNPADLEGETAAFEATVDQGFGIRVISGTDQVPAMVRQPAQTQDRPAGSPSTLPQEQQTVPAKGQLLGDAWEVYTLDQIAVRKRKRGNLIHAKSSLKLMIGVCGDRPITEYTRGDAAGFPLIRP